MVAAGDGAALAAGDAFEVVTLWQLDLDLSAVGGGYQALRRRLGGTIQEREVERRDGRD
jgi:hypothetical protein